MQKIIILKYFNVLIGLSIEEMKECGNASDAFQKAMQYPIDVISERFSKTGMDERPLQVVQWSSGQKKMRSIHY